MRVFKACFRVIRRHAVSLLIYVFIFLGFAIALSGMGGEKQQTSFTASRVRVAFYDSDGGTPLVRGLRDSLAARADIVAVPDTLQARQDALFYRDVHYIIRVPKGFTDSFLSGGGMRLERTAVSASASGVYTDFLVERYLRLAAVMRSVPGITQQQMAADVKTSLSEQAAVEVHAFGGVEGTRGVTYYFRYLAYVLMAVVILGVTSTMLVFNQPDLRRRNFCSPLHLVNMNLQLVLGNLTFALAAWAVLCGISFLLYRGDMLTPAAPLLVLDSLVYTLVCLSLAFLVGNLIRSRNAQSAVANVLSLGSCFISGVFVPQEYLGKGVLTFASFLPTYWYVTIVNELNGLTASHPVDSRPIAAGVLIQLGFAAALLAVSLAVAKYKRTGEDMTYENLEQ